MSPMTQPSPIAPMIPIGEHRLTLQGVEVKKVDNLKFLKGDKTQPPKVDKWLWRFISDDRDEETGLPFELAVWTFANYGHARATLTKLLDMILPKLPKEEKEHLNTDELLGRRYKAQVIHELNTNNEMQPKAAYIVELKPGEPGYDAPRPIANTDTRPNEIPV